MMKVSTKTTYAIRALMDLGTHPKEVPVRLAGVAERQHIPLPFLEQIFSKLRKAGLVEAIRGPQGGYRLTKNPSDMTLAEIITTLEGPMEPVMCIMPENRSPQCHHEGGCVSRLVCNELDGELSRILSRTTLDNLCSRAKKTSSKGTKIPLRLDS